MSGPFISMLIFIGAFILGSCPTAYLAGRWLKKIDIREHGSGNSGATNVFRVMGKGPGTVVFIVDFLKGFLPVFLVGRFYPEAILAHPEYLIWVGFSAILGHVFSPFLGFRGGKGVATGAGVLSAAFPVLFFIVTGIWIAVFVITRIVSISSIISLCSLVIVAFLFRYPPLVYLSFLGIALFVIWTHRSNITRLFASKESQFKK